MAKSVNNDKITIAIKIKNNKKIAFDSFVNKFNKWWPEEYTWSGNVLEIINIEPKVNGKCYEIGPNHFRYDWGRVLKFEHPNKIVFTWQISPSRVPEPNPDKVSEIKIEFITINKSFTRTEFEHKCFSKHGDGWENYLETLKSEQGWPYILDKFKMFCENV